MSERSEEVQYEQDRLGNENRKLDELRGQEGMSAETEEGLVEFGSADTGTVTILQSKPTHADQMIVTQLQGYNSVGSGANTFQLYELTLDGNGAITDQTERSVPIEVESSNTRIESYQGAPFESAIGVSTEFQGWIGVGFISDHKEYSEPQSQDY